MLCAISGEAPQAPVASRKSGTIFEKRLIEAYISENGRDPVTNEELTTDDLVELKSARVVRPRPPTLTSIPSLLSVFQNEWDALALETYTLRQQLIQARQELSTALYQHDASVRVIARLSRERDEAREALSKVAINGSSTVSGDSMQVDGQELPKALIATIEATQEKLSKTRRKRAIPNGWIDSGDLRTFTLLKKSQGLYPNSRTFAVDRSGDLALLGGDNGTLGVFSVSKDTFLHEFNVGNHAITDVLWAGTMAIIATSKGAVIIFENETEVANISAHAGEVTGLALHPSEEILASVGRDKSYAFYDLTTKAQVTQVQTDSALTTAAFHPDGHLFAAGGTDGQIKVFDVKSGTNAANFQTTGPVSVLSFSENGTWLASVAKESSSISIWDLRKSAEIKVIDIGSLITAAEWDYTGQFLGIAGPRGIVVKHYSKASKEWSEPVRLAVPAIAVAWGPRAQSIIALDTERCLTVLGVQ